MCFFIRRGGYLMVKKREDFETEQEYLEYVSTPEFLEAYSIKGKTVDEIVEDMRLPKEWMPYIKKVYQENMLKKRYEGIYFYYDVENLVIEDEDYDACVEALEKEKQKEGGDS